MRSTIREAERARRGRGTACKESLFSCAARHLGPFSLSSGRTRMRESNPFGNHPPLKPVNSRSCDGSWRRCKPAGQAPVDVTPVDAPPIVLERFAMRFVLFLSGLLLAIGVSAATPEDTVRQ